MSKRTQQGFDHPVASEITPQAVYRSRREWLRKVGLATLGSLAAAGAAGAVEVAAQGRRPRLPASRNAIYSTHEALTPYTDVTSYNNYYEFGTGKSDPARYAGALPTRPWTVVVDGLVHKPRTFGIEELLRLAPMEERVYRHRCVEAWSMVIPWIGYPLARLLDAVQPAGNARFVEFHTLLDPAHMPGQNSDILQWPYVEGLRLDEAMHPLTLLSFGLYGELLPTQNGAPLRLVIPWKYGFKGAKAIVRVRLVDKQPVTSWMRAVPDWYGFYSNVNPAVSPQNWSQAQERRIGQGAYGGLFTPDIPTRLFNGYGDQVAHLYQGMDLTREF